MITQKQTEVIRDRPTMQKKIMRRSYEQNKLATLSSIPALLQRIYAARDVRSIADIDRSLSALLPFRDLMDSEKAAARLIEAILNQETILIIGDFDADVATSTAVELAKKTKSPDLIITVDNGIASIDGVMRANEYGIDVIVTDHHLQGMQLPNAYAIVNPNRKEDLFQSKSLAGVGVIFYVMLAVRAALDTQNYFSKNNITKPNMAALLDLVVLGTIADVVPLDKNNRILVHQGLQRIRANLVRPGIRALLQIAGRSPQKLSAMDLGFSIGPRLNAAGRLDDMSLGINCLISSDFDQALELANMLDQLNIERRVIEQEMKQQAFDVVDKLDLEKKLPLGICLYDESWHQGVIGLVASRVKDKLHRPVIAFAKADEENLKGSARSIMGVHIRDMLDEIATQYPTLLSKFGGHAMAAGLSIRLKDFREFSTVFEKTIERYLDENKLFRVIETDGELSADDFMLENAELLKDE